MIGMDFITYSHRNAEVLFLHDPRYSALYQEIVSAIQSISDQEIIDAYNAITRTNKKSISQPINRLLKLRLETLGWNPESMIFADPEYRGKSWRLDFAKDEISIEVAFNHGEAISWNLLKPVMASELNHIQKEIQTSAGIVITATQAMHTAGNFDSAVGTFEKFKRYLTPMYNILPTPLLLIGLQPPRTFYINSTTKQVVRRAQP